MTKFPPRSGSLALVLLAALGLGGQSQPYLLSSARAQTSDAPAVTPSTAETIAAPTLQEPPAVSGSAAASASERKLASDMVRTDSKGRHLAPHGTFYLLSYVSVKTDKGVEGFPPGAEVKFVEANRDKQTLVVTDGHAQVEVPASKLTNDLDVAAMVKNNDQAMQGRIAAYAQAEQEAYNKFQREAAEATAKDLDEKRKEQDDQIREAQQERTAQRAQAAQGTAADTQVASSYNDGYYNDGGYGYGSPYSYFTGGGTPITVAPQQPNTPGTGTGTAAGASVPNRIAAPRGGAGGGGGPTGPATAPQGNTGAGAPSTNAGAAATSGSSNTGGGRPK